MIGTKSFVIVILISGFMSVTMFLSMWISNTAAMALMVPIVDSITEATSSDDDDDNDDNDKKSDKDKVRNYYLLSCAYAANMGGTGVITGMIKIMIMLHKRDGSVNIGCFRDAGKPCCAQHS